MDGLGIGATLSYNEQSGFGASVGLQAGTSALSYNAGLSYSQRDGISANAGIGLGLGKNAATGSYSSTLNLGVSYNRRDGFGTSVGISRNNNVVMPGVGATISRSEYGGFGAEITSNQYGQTEGAGGRPGFGGVSGGLSWSERDGFTASFNVSGTNAFSYNSQTGLSSNTDFLSQSAMNNGLSQGVAQTDEEKAHAARVEAEERARAAQNRNNSEQGAQVLEGYGVRREGDDYSQNHGDIDNDGKNKGSGVDPTKLEVNQYERFQNRDGASESLSKGVNETNPAIAGQYKDGQMHKEFTAEIDLKRSKIAENEKNLSLADKNKMNDLMKQRADIQSQYDAISMNGKVSDKTTELLKLKAQTLTNQINDIRVGDAFGYRGSEAHNQTQLMEKMVQLKEKEAYGTLSASEKKDLAKVTSGLESYQRYGQVRDLILNNNISSTQLGSTTTAAICFVNAHSNYQGVDTKTNYFLQAQSGNIGMTNSDYRGMKSPALGLGSGWSMDLTKLSNPASGEVHVTRTQVDILNRSGANNAIVFTDTTGDGNPNHWQRVVRDKDGVWQDINNNRKDKNELRPMDFSKVYQIKYNDNW
ncbi:hypothetical protein LEP1GSC130_3575 [Leptospira santarosai str. 200403458]|nr:hypothetical protein LEP1GSC130_3575 [Leptospira santarosai str. 200403458]